MNEYVADEASRTRRAGFFYRAGFFQSWHSNFGSLGSRRKLQLTRVAAGFRWNNRCGNDDDDDDDDDDDGYGDDAHCENDNDVNDNFALGI